MTLSLNYTFLSLTLQTSHKSWRPIAVLSLRLSHNLYGSDARGYHLDNVLLHAVVTYCYSVFCFQLINSYTDENKTKTTWTAATLASIMFAVHPIHTEPVASVVGRSDLLCGFFFVVAIMLYRAHFVVSAILTGVCSTLSKEVGVTVFGIFAASDIIDLISTHEQLSPFPKPKLVNVVRYTGMNFAMAALLTLLHLSLHGETKIYSWTVLENSIALLDDKSSRILSYAHVTALYIWKLVYPFNLSYDYGWPCAEHVTALTDYRNLGTLMAAIAILSIGWCTLKQMNAILLWSISLATISFVPASNLFFPVGTMLAERLLYLPSMGVCLGAGYSLAQLIHSAKCPDNVVGENNAQKRVKGVSFILLCAYLNWMAMKTIHRCTEWSTEARLFESALNVCAKSLKVLNNYAQLHLSTDPRHAISYLSECIC